MQSTSDRSTQAAGIAALEARIAQLERQLARADSRSDAQLTEQRYRTLADAMPQMVWATDANGAHFYFNRRWYEYTGLSEAESLGFGFASALHPDDREPTLAHWERAWRAGESYEIEYRFRRHDGVYHWFIGRARPVVDPDGVIREWVGTCTDIDEQKRASEVQSFLSDATTLLAASLDYRVTLAQFAQLAVPHLADWCAVDVLDDNGQPQRLAVAHVDPDKVALAHELYRRTPFNPDAPGGVARVLRSGESEIIPEITDEVIHARVADPEIREIMLRLGLRSSMVVPITARGRTLGALTLVSAESGRHFTPGDLQLAEDLARRAAIAIDNARLFHDQRQFRLTLDQIHDCVFMFEPESLRFFYVNQGAIDQVGYSRDELLQMTPVDIKPRLDESQFRAMIAPLLSGEESLLSFETVHRHRDGNDIPVEIALQYVAPEDAGARFVAVVRDISARKRIEDELRRQSDLTRTIAENATPALFMMDARGRCTYMNLAAEAMIGYTLDEIRDMPLHDAIHHHHPDGRPYPMTECPIDRALPEDNSIRAHEDIFIRKNGEFFPVLVAASPIFAGGQPVGTVVEVRDVTDEKRAQAERERLIAQLDAERARLTSLFHEAPAFIAALRGPDHVFEMANPLYLQLVGHRDVVGKPVVEALPEVVDQGFVQLLDTVQQTGEAIVGTEVRILLQRTPGSPPEERFVNFVYQPMSGENGAIDGIFVHGVDVTDMVHARVEVERKADELTRLAHALEASNRELDQFAYITSHDLKAPLRGIANLSQWIEEDLGDHVTDEVRQHLELLRGRAYRMEALIDGILQYSRVGRTTAAAERVDVGELLADTIDLLGPEPHVTISVAPDMPVLRAERLPLQQVFQNLIGNAIKHHPGGPVAIRIDSQPRGSMVEFAVSDNGTGIDPEYHERIFGIFQTLASRDKVEGSGLGLALVKKIIERQQGRIWVESQEGAGATFRFTWPRESRQEQA
jgi:PAS domain S-box-containing protein